MKKFNALSKTEMKNVLGGGVPPETPGGDESYCVSRGKGYTICITQGGSGEGITMFYACCSSMEEARSNCPSGSAYGCSFSGFPTIE